MFGGKENLVREFPLEFIAHKIVIQIGRIPHTIPISKEENKFGFAITKLQIFTFFPISWDFEKNGKFSDTDIYFSPR